MSRKVRKIRRRGVEPDLVYNNLLAARFINIIMHQGKKSVARRIFYTALERVAEKSGAEPIEAFNQAIENIRPGVEVRSRRVGGANYQIPVEVRPERQMALAMRWLLGAARSRGERTMSERLSGEILDACNKGGSAVKKREDTHRMAEANKAFAHYRW